MRGKKITKEDIEKIKLFRQQGFSINEISKNVNTSKTTVLRYISNVKIFSEYVPFWKQKRGGSRSIMLKKRQKAFEEAVQLVGNLSYKEKMLFLSALYWAEGSKKDFGLSNTDPQLIKTYIIFLKEVFDVKYNDLRISIRIYDDLDKNECLKYWSKITEIPKEKFVSINILSGRKKGKLQYGMCRVRVAKSGDLLKKIMAINAVVAETVSS